MFNEIKRRVATQLVSPVPGPRAGRDDSRDSVRARLNLMPALAEDLIALGRAEPLDAW